VNSCDSAAIIGLGLVGGSLARDLAARGVRVSAYDANAEHLASAVRDGVVHCAMDATLAGARDAQIIIIAVPVDAAVDVLRALAAHANGAALITDVGSTKVRIVATAVEAGLGERFVGAHPMAGGHHSGWAASHAGLVDGARVYLCPTPSTSGETLRVADAFWRELGARPACMPADHHDRKLAWASHLPHVVSTVTALVLARAGIGRHDLGPGGRDVTRLAGSSPDVWTAIARDNADAIDAALADAEREIASFRRALGEPDSRELRDRFVAARDWFDQ
jgi:prephenate dehydrogenase